MAGTPDDFLGRGWSFPLRVNSRGGISLSPGGRDIEEAIRVILSTAKGERHMRPEFGCGIHTLVFAPYNANTLNLIDHYIREALGMWEPRIDVTDVVVESDSVEHGLVLISVFYTVRATNDERNLVYPFYLIHSE
jgi:phage baseplate assembly protein W